MGHKQSTHITQNCPRFWLFIYKLLKIKWRRERDSNPQPSLKTWNLLILRSAKSSKSIRPSASLHLITPKNRTRFARLLNLPESRMGELRRESDACCVTPSGSNRGNCGERANNPVPAAYLHLHADSDEVREHRHRCNQVLLTVNSLRNNCSKGYRKPPPIGRCRLPLHSLMLQDFVFPNIASFACKDNRVSRLQCAHKVLPDSPVCQFLVAGRNKRKRDV